MEIRSNKLIVVLGMHRSGTSVVTRGLRVLGVDLGDNLQPPMAGVNDKGFFEDNDIVNLNVEMIESINEDWHHLAAIEKSDIDFLRNKGYFLRAVELLRKKIGVVIIFGFKDPRTAKLMPFWKEVFNHCQLDVNYVLAVRHPLSVVKSLAKRDGFDAEKSYLLWLGHVIRSLADSKGGKRIVVDYDRLIRSPAEELNRIASCFGLQVNHEELENFQSEFLDLALRHTVYDSKDLLLDKACPPLVQEIYPALLDVAMDKVSIDDPELQERVDSWALEFDRKKSSLTLADKLYSQKTAISQVVSERDRQISGLDRQISNLDQALIERDAHIASLNHAVAERDDWISKLNVQIAGLNEGLKVRDGSISGLNQSLIDRDGKISALNQSLADRDEKIAALDQAVIERDSRISNLNQVVTARDEQIANLEQALKARDQQITNLGQIISDREEQISSLDALLDELLNSTSWRLTLPARFVATQIKRVLRKTKAILSSIRMGGPTRRSQENPLEAAQTDGLPGSAPRVSWIDFHPVHDQFVEHRKNPPIDPLVKLIAFYLPQFHPFPENDEWWGKGFTEWTNVGKALPNYVGHYQPHYPIHFGYYDLRIPEVMEEQARLAREYGLYGFSYYFYWFGGTILMDTPLELMLSNKNIDIPFCLTWANENWSRRWDGLDHDILIAQNHSDEDSLAFIRHLVKYFNDERYIRIDGKPVLIIYRANSIPNMAATAAMWREEMLKHGIPGLYLVSAQVFGVNSPTEFGFDASVQFSPLNAPGADIKDRLDIVNPNFKGSVYSYEWLVRQAESIKEPDYKLFRTAVLSWDNTARKQNNSQIFHGFSLALYGRWLDWIVKRVLGNAKYAADEKIVFVNAWNEWAEGAHLEPDRKFGYGYLQATYDVLKNYGELSSQPGDFSEVDSHADESQSLQQSKIESRSRRKNGTLSNKKSKPKDALDIGSLDEYLVGGQAAAPIIIFDHNLGGGANNYSRVLTKAALANGGAVLRVYNFECSGWYVERLTEDGVKLFFTKSEDKLLKSLSGSHSREIIVNSLYGVPDPKRAVDMIVDLARGLKADLDYKVNDFFCHCPSPHLSDYAGNYCGVPLDSSTCNYCLSRNRAWYPVGYPKRNYLSDIGGWRDSFSQLFEVATQVSFFDASSIGIFRKVYQVDDRKISLTPHGDDYFECDRQVSLEGPLHIGILGTLTHIKGADVVRSLSNYIEVRGLKIPISVVGACYEDMPPRVNILGPYEHRQLPRIIEARRINVILVASIVPETFGFSISEAMKMGLPIVAFDLGAQGSRVNQYKIGRTIPLGSPPELILGSIQSALQAAQELTK